MFYMPFYNRLTRAVFSMLGTQSPAILYTYHDGKWELLLEKECHGVINHHCLQLCRPIVQTCILPSLESLQILQRRGFS